MPLMPARNVYGIYRDLAPRYAVVYIRIGINHSWADYLKEKLWKSLN